MKRAEMIVSEKHLASSIGSGNVAVFSTPSLIAFVENTCKDMLYETSVGTYIACKHIRSTPLGMKVMCEAQYLGVNEKGLHKFEAKVYDEIELIGICQHQRAVVNEQEFVEKTNQKKTHAK
ncbi:MAG: hypothetical protein GXY98_01065 [Erysipelothrix sp.]|nr:hypothetical protein [Erysipelothrix sp.]